MRASDLLAQFKITETDTRIMIMNILLRSEQTVFTVDEILCNCVASGGSMREAVVAGVIRLFHRRGLLVSAGVQKADRRGRPAIVYRISPVVVEH